MKPVVTNSLMSVSGADTISFEADLLEKVVFRSLISSYCVLYPTAVFSLISVIGY